MDSLVAVFDDGQVSLDRLELPERANGEIDIAIDAAAVCGSDLHTVLGHRSTPPRTALGHEGVGRILDSDDGSTDHGGSPLSPGDRVAFAIYAACGECDRCRAGLAMKCRHLLKYGHESVTRPPHATGTLATIVRLTPGVPVFRIPDGLTDAQVVSASCAVATAAGIVRTADRPNAALVVGAGAVGTYCAAMLAGAGTEVSVIDLAEDRLDLAESMGAKRLSDSGRSFPVVIEASGSAAAFEQALAALDIGGTIVAAGSVSPGSTTVTLDPALIVTRLLTIVGVHNYTPDDMRSAIEWLAGHADRLRLERLVSPPIPLSKVRDAFELMETGSHLRVMVVPEGTE